MPWGGGSELRAMAWTVSNGPHTQPVLGEMGEVRAVIQSGAIAALSNAERFGPGRIRHRASGS